MHTPVSLEQQLLNKLQAFLSFNRKNTDPKQIEWLSAELTASTKQPGFVSAAHSLLISASSLGQQKKDKEVLLTSLLKDKFKFEYESLEVNIQSHYQQLCEIASHMHNCNYATYTNVSLSLAYTYLHLLGSHSSSLDLFLAPLIPKDPTQMQLYNFYFKALEYIATEIDNSKFVIDQVQRETARERLVSQQLTVLKSLNDNAVQAFAVENLNKENILNCFEAWITLHYDPIVLNSLPNHALFHQVLAHIQDEECGEGASNCLRSIIYQLKDPEQNKAIYETLSTCTLQILALVEQSLKDFELDKAEDFMRIIADFARKSTTLFIQKFDRHIEAFLNKLIYHLQDDLMNTYENIADFFEEFLDALKKLKKEGTTHINPQIYHLLQPLYNGLCYKCQIPMRIMKELDRTEEGKAHHISTMAEELFRNREFTDDLFESIGQLQGKQPFLAFVFGKIQGLNPTDEKGFWPMLEIYLYSIIEVSMDYPTLDTSAVSLLKIYLELAGKPEPIPVCVRRTFLRVFRAFTTSSHKDPEFIYRIMCTTVSCFDEPLLSAVAQKTFCRACEQNKHIAIGIFKQFGPVLANYPQRDYIVKGLVTVMCSDSALITEYLAQTLIFLFTKYREEQEKPKRKEYMHSMVAALKAFKESPLAKEHMSILLQFMRQIWPFAKQMLSSPQRQKDDEDSDIERIVRILKVLMRTLQFQFSQFLQELFTTVLTAFQRHPICSYVYLVQVAVTVYSGNPAYTDYLRRLYSDFCQIAFDHMRKIEDVGRFSYLLDDFMGMNKRFFLYNASIVLSSGKLPDIIDMLINGFIGCDTPRVAKAAYSFFQTIFMVYWRSEFVHFRNSQEDITPFFPKPEDAIHYQALKTFLLQKLQVIIGKMLQHLANAPTEQTRDYIMDALVSQIKGFTEENPAVWAQLLMNVPSEILVQKEKERMVLMLESLKMMDFENARQTVKSLDRMLVLINRRMVNADKRRNINF